MGENSEKTNGKELRSAFIVTVMVLNWYRTGNEEQWNQQEQMPRHFKIDSK